MYCAKCRRDLYYRDPENHGYCFNCDQIVNVENCKISSWNLIAVLMMFWTLSV